MSHTEFFGPGWPSQAPAMGSAAHRNDSWMWRDHSYEPQHRLPARRTVKPDFSPLTPRIPETAPAEVAKAPESAPSTLALENSRLAASVSKQASELEHQNTRLKRAAELLRDLDLENNGLRAEAASVVALEAEVTRLKRAFLNAELGTKPASRPGASREALGKLTYFPVMAKGLQLALIAEHSGLAWEGATATKGDTEQDWPGLKPKTPFGQMPFLETAEDGTVGQSVRSLPLQR